MIPRVCILHTDGTNCDGETATAFELAGGRPERVLVTQLRRGNRTLADYQMLAIPGGFSYGDDVASGKILAVELVSFLRDQLEAFVAAGKPVIGICNGFQVLVKCGLLPDGTLGEQSVTLTDNASGHFECRWVDLLVSKNCPSLWTQGFQDRTISLMVAHGEGMFLAPRETTFSVLNQTALYYVCPEGKAGSADYPYNPNGSPLGIAGICNQQGNVFGLMPHPERFVRREQHPNWRRQPDLQPHGLPFFANAVNYAKSA